MEKKVIVCAFCEMDEDDFHFLEIYENVTDPRSIFNLDTEERALVFNENGKKTMVDLEEVEWYRYVSSDSHLANYVRKKEKYDCEWDCDGVPL